MADFEGEDFISDEELAQINAQRQFNPHQMQQHLSNLASMYHTHLPHGKLKLTWGSYGVKDKRYIFG